MTSAKATVRVNTDTAYLVLAGSAYPELRDRRHVWYSRARASLKTLVLAGARREHCRVTVP